jgi:RNA polymerase sigma factor (sigma-70 family)
MQLFPLMRFSGLVGPGLGGAMSLHPLDSLLEKLSGGDAAAAEQIFVAYEPYLRMVVRKQLPVQFRAKFDSCDIVQSVWADVLDGFRAAGWRFANAVQLRAFLVKLTRNRFIDRLRHHQRSMAHEQQLPQGDVNNLPPSREPRPSEVAQADELWQKMLALCPPAHHELLRLKREGRSLAEIAAQTGLHPSSVRRILYDLGRRLAASRRPGFATENE